MLAQATQDHVPQRWLQPVEVEHQHDGGHEPGRPEAPVVARQLVPLRDQEQRQEAEDEDDQCVLDRRAQPGATLADRTDFRGCGAGAVQERGPTGVGAARFSHARARLYPWASWISYALSSASSASAATGWSGARATTPRWCARTTVRSCPSTPSSRACTSSFGRTPTPTWVTKPSPPRSPILRRWASGAVMRMSRVACLRGRAQHGSRSWPRRWRRSPIAVA